MKYRKRPVTIEAFRLGYDDIPEWARESKAIEFKKHRRIGEYIVIRTLEGIMKGFEGEYIIKGVRGEIYACKADIFEETYEEEAK